MNTLTETLLTALRYLFHPIPGSPTKFFGIGIYIPLLVVAGILLIVAGYGKWYMKKKGRDDRAFKKLFESAPYTLLWLAILLLLNVFGRYERFPLLGARFVTYALGIVIAYKAYRYISNYLRVYPKEQERFKELPTQKKYTTEKYKH